MTSQPRKTFQNLSSQKKERITRVAIEEFAAKGFDGASINAIVENLKIAKGSIFQYFGDKKGLFMFVFEQSVEMVKNYLRNVRDQSINDDLPARLKKTLSAGVRFINRHPLLYRLYLRVLFDAKAPFRDEILLSLRKYSHEFLESMLETANARKELRAVLQIDKAAFMLDAVMDRFLQTYAVSHLDAGLGIFRADEKHTDEWINALVEFIFEGIGGTHKNGRPHILILTATEDEVSDLFKPFENLTESQIGCKKILNGTIRDIDIKVLITGPGLINTSQALTAAVEQARPSLIIQTGCGGAFKESGLKAGDVGIATFEIDAQLGIESSQKNGFPENLPFVLFRSKATEYTNQYPVDAQWLEQAVRSLAPVAEQSGFEIKKGPFITVSTITASDGKARDLFNRFHAVVEQMEGSAAAYVSALYSIPFLEIRGISNWVGKRDKKSWNLPLACKNGCEAILTFIQQFDREALKYGDQIR